MRALINDAENFTNKIKFNNLVALCKQKIEDCIINDRLIVISASNSCVEMRNTILIEDCECNEEDICLNDGNFELHLKINDIEKAAYDDTCDEYFTFVYKDGTEINLCFL